MLIRLVRCAACLGALFALLTATAETASCQSPQTSWVPASGNLASGGQLLLNDRVGISGFMPREMDPSSAAQEVPAPDLKSEQAAFTLSLASTVLPVALGGVMMAVGDTDSGVGTAGSLIAGLGLYLGPATGYWYGGASGRGWRGFGIRFGTAMVAGAALYAICGAGDSDCSIVVADEGTTAAASVVALAATGVILFSAIWDVAKVKSHVREANEAKLANHGASLSVMPVVNPFDGGSAGLVATISF